MRCGHLAGRDDRLALSDETRQRPLVHWDVAVEQLVEDGWMAGFWTSRLPLLLTMALTCFVRSCNALMGQLCSLEDSCSVGNLNSSKT